MSALDPLEWIERAPPRTGQTGEVRSPISCASNPWCAGDLSFDIDEVEVIQRMVPFGKFICSGTHPKCSALPMLERGRKVGVITQLAPIARVRFNI